MLKGVNKRIVEINNTNNVYFEKAILYVRPDTPELSTKQLAKEAEYYLNSLCPEISRDGKRFSKKTVITVAVAVFLALGLMIFLLLL